MKVLHAGLMADRFLVCGETAGNSSAKPPARRGRRKSEGQGVPFPYDSGDSLLLTLKVNALAGLANSPETWETVKAWLPTINGWPIASFDLLRFLGTGRVASRPAK